MSIEDKKLKWTVIDKQAEKMPTLSSNFPTVME